MIHNDIHDNWFSVSFVNDLANNIWHKQYDIYQKTK